MLFDYSEEPQVPVSVHRSVARESSGLPVKTTSTGEGESLSTDPCYGHWRGGILELAAQSRIGISICVSQAGRIYEQGYSPGEHPFGRVSPRFLLWRRVLGFLPIPLLAALVVAFYLLAGT